MYSQMVEMRRMEMAADKLYKEKMIRGFCHLAIGQEAVSVGMESAIEPDDKVITAYRCHPFAVLRGGTVKGVIAELLGALIYDVFQFLKRADGGSLYRANQAERTECHTEREVPCISLPNLSSEEMVSSVLKSQSVPVLLSLSNTWVKRTSTLLSSCTVTVLQIKVRSSSLSTWPSYGTW